MFVVRHGQSNYLERKHVKETGYWNPEMDDLNVKGKVTVAETAQTIASMIDKDHEIVVFLSSPRARTLTIQRIITDCFHSQGIQVDEKMSASIEVLRSGGNNSPVADERGKVVNPDNDRTSYDASHLNAEGSEPVSGERFRQVIAFLSSINGPALETQIRNDLFKGKRPVFVVVTHGEALHAQGYHSLDYKNSFLGAAFPDQPINSHVENISCSILTLHIRVHSP